MSIEPEQAGGAPGADRLAELAAARGEPLAGGGNRPIQLTDPGVLCFVAEGSVDVFAARRRADGVPVDFKHLLRAGAGRLLFPAVEGLTGTVLVAKGLPGSALCLMPLDALDAARCDEQVVAQVDAWVSEVSEAVTREFTYRPRIDRILSAEAGEQPVEAEQSLSARRGVVWMTSGDASLAYLGTEEADPDSPDAVPVTPASWVTSSKQARVRCVTTPELQGQGRLMSALATFNELALSADDLNRRLLLADVANLQTSTAEFRRRGEQNARRRLFGVLESGARRGRDDLALPRGRCDGSVVTKVSPSACPTAGRSARGPPPRRRRWPTSWRPRACACDASPCAGSNDGGWVTAARCSPSAGTTARPSPYSRDPWDATGWWSRSPAASGRSTPGGPRHWSGRPTFSTVRCPTMARSGPGSFRGWRSNAWGPTWSGWSGPGCSRARPCWFPRCCWEPSWGRRCPPAPCRCWGC